MKRTFLLIGLICAFFLSSQGISAKNYCGRILKIDFDEPVAENNKEEILINLKGLDYIKSHSILDYERMIAKAADDPGIGMIFLAPDNFNGDLSQAEELRATLQKFKASGKPIISYITNDKNYYLASVADTVCMNTSGTACIKGMATVTKFYGELLDSLRIGIQTPRNGEYKSAIEPYTRKEMSEKNREQYSRLINSVWGTVSKEITSSRNIDEMQFQSWVDNLELTSPQSMLDHSLVDKLLYRDEMEKYLTSLSGLRNISKKDVIYDSRYLTRIKSGHYKNKVAVISVDGTIGNGNYGDVNCNQIVDLLASARKDSSVKALVLRINSPGGEVFASDLIHREINETRKVKPIIASFGHYAASGGYWISSKADYIIANNTTITGSIGVFQMIPDLSGFYNDKLRIGISTVGSNKHSDILGMYRKLSPFELEISQKRIDETYDKFINIVAEGRKMKIENANKVAGGRVWSGEDALGLGLADANGTILDAVEYAARVAGINRYSIKQMEYSEPLIVSEILGAKPHKQLVNTGDKVYALCPDVDTVN